MGQGKSDYILSIVEGNESSKQRYFLLWMILQKVIQAALKKAQRGSKAGYKLVAFCSGPDGRWP